MEYIRKLIKEVKSAMLICLGHSRFDRTLFCCWRHSSLTSQRLPYHVSCKGNPKSEALWSLFCLALDTTALGQAIQAVRLSCEFSHGFMGYKLFHALSKCLYYRVYIYIRSHPVHAR